jgi:tetratricopeptide (TPR) repeat protein
MLCLAAAPAGAQMGVGITIPSAAISTISDPNEALRYAREQISQHDLPGAVLALRRYVMNYPDEGVVVRFLGDLYFSSGDLDDAARIYDHLVRDYPLDRDTHYQLGRLYTVENRVDDAIEQFDDSLPDARAIYYLVLLHQRKGDLAAFREQIQHQAEARPNDLDAQLDAAQLFGALYMPRDAGAEFERALAIAPRSQEALEGLGMAQTAENANANAAISLQRCLAIDAKNYGCLAALGMLDIQTHQYAEAKAELEQASALAPEEPEAVFWLGRLADARGDWQAASTYYEQAIYVWPYDPDPYVQLAFDEEEHGMHAQAQQLVLKGLDAADDARLHYLLGYMYREDGQQALALAQFLLAEQSLSPEVAQLAKQSAEELGNRRP